MTLKYSRLDWYLVGVIVVAPLPTLSDLLFGESICPHASFARFGRADYVAVVGLLNGGGRLLLIFPALLAVLGLISSRRALAVASVYCAICAALLTHLLVITALAGSQTMTHLPSHLVQSVLMLTADYYPILVVALVLVLVRLAYGIDETARDDQAARWVTIGVLFGLGIMLFALWNPWHLVWDPQIGLQAQWWRVVASAGSRRSLLVAGFAENIGRVLFPVLCVVLAFLMAARIGSTRVLLRIFAVGAIVLALLVLLELIFSLAIPPVTLIGSEGVSATWLMWRLSGSVAVGNLMSFGPMAVLIAWFWWPTIWRKRSMTDLHCRKCGYDLTGNVSGRCPECGMQIHLASVNSCQRDCSGRSAE